MDAIKRGITKLKKKRVLLRFFAVLLGLSLLCACVCTFFLGHVILGEQNAQVMELSMGRLVTTRDKVDASVNALSNYLRGDLWMADNVDLMISLDLSDRPRNTRIVTGLHAKVGEYDLVSDALLYSHGLGYVFLPNGTWIPLEAYEGRENVEGYLEQRESLKKESRLRFGRLFRTEGEFFLCFDLVTPIYVGSLFYQLDTDQLAAMLSGEEGPVYVLDSAGEFVLPPSEPVDLDDPDILFLEEGALTVRNLPDSARAYYRTTSQVTGWTFLAPAEVGGLLDYLPELLTVLIPFLLLYVLLCAGLAVMLSRNLYRPIHTLLSISDAHGGEDTEEYWADAQDETSFLKTAYEKTYDQNKQYQDAFKVVSREVQEQVVQKLLMGRPLGQDYVKNTLASVGGSDLLTTRFVVMAVFIEQKESQSDALRALTILRRTVVRLAKKELPDHCRFYPVTPAEDRLALVLCFPENEAPDEIGRVMGSLQRDAADATADMLTTLFWGSSRVYDGLSQLNQAWKEAAEAALCRRYAADDQPTEVPLLRPQGETGEAYLFHTLKECLNLAAEGRKGECDESLNFLFERLQVQIWDQEEAAGTLERLHDEAVETLTLYGVEPEELERLSGQWKGRQSELDSGQLRDFLDEAVQIVQTSGRKNKFKYVEEAKAYVSRSYMNSDLSLNAVSEYIGISSTYLSTLFKEISKEKFNAYLGAYRVEQAKLLLRNTSLSNADIGYRCGFNSNQSFYRVFKKVTNLTPSQYRESLRKESGNG